MGRKLGSDSRATEGELNEGARPGRLDDLYSSRHRCAAWPHESTRLVRAEVLGAHTENELPPLFRKSFQATLVERKSLAGLEAENGRVVLNLREAGNKIHLRRAEKACNETGDGALEEIERSALLLDQSVAHENDAVRKCHGLDLVVCHVDHRLTKLLMEALDFAAHLIAQLRIKIGQRLV